LSQNAQSSNKRVAIILGYFDGASYIRNQIKSIFQQTHTAFHIYIFDDNSAPYFSFAGSYPASEELSKITLCMRPENIGFTENFLNGLASVPDDFEYFAFSDQDDIWYKDKLERSIAALEKVPSKTPALFCSRTEISDETCGKTLGYSPLFKKLPSFKNSLVQNVGGGNTMLFNKAAKDLIVKATEGTKILFHDWWCYQIVAGAGGQIIYDKEPSLKYRQHDRNIIGANSNWRQRIARIHALFNGHFREWNDTNLQALLANKDLLTITNQGCLNDFIKARQSPLIKRLILFKRSGINRQSFFGNLALFLGVIFNKV
jgi:glycosyltransferase involved in cell wall biosynthesis